MGFDVIGCGSTGEEYDQLAEVLPLMEQRIDALDVATLSALTPEVISRQVRQYDDMNLQLTIRLKYPSITAYFFLD